MRLLACVRRAGAALALAAFGLLGGCGGSGGSSGTKLPDPKPFPDLGYRYVAPRLPTHLSADAVLLVDMTNTGGVRPAQLRFASDGALSRVHWTSWGADPAVGRGTATVRICTSSCGAGYNKAFAATVTLAGIKLCSGRRFYDSARVSLATPTGPMPWGSYIHAPC